MIEEEPMGDASELENIAKNLGIGSIQRHMFVCVGDKCCSVEEGMNTWNWLKKRVKEQDTKDAGVYRTKVGCLRICREGPVAVVYPEGTWYRNVTPEVCERIVNEHLLNGKPVEQFIFAKNPL